MFQVLYTEKNDGYGGVYIPFGSMAFTSVAEAKVYMAAHAMYPIVWRDGCESTPATGKDVSETGGYYYMIVRLSVFGNDAVIVQVEKIKAMQQIVDRMSARLDAYPGQTAQQIADHKMDGGL